MLLLIYFTLITYEQQIVVSVENIVTMNKITIKYQGVQNSRFMYKVPG